MVTNGMTYSITNTKQVILEKLYMLFQIYVLLSYKQYNIRLILVRNSVTSKLLKLNTTPGLYPNMILSPTIDKFEHDKVIDIAYNADSLINSSLLLRIKYSDVYMKKQVRSSSRFASNSHQIAIVTICDAISTQHGDATVAMHTYALTGKSKSNHSATQLEWYKHEVSTSSL